MNKMREINREIVSAVIISKDGKILLNKENPKMGGVYLDSWHIPGGGLKEGETKKEGVMREVMEEVGIDVSEYEIKLIDDLKFDTREKTLESGERILAHMHFNDYKVDIVDKDADEIEVKISEEISEYHWFERSELPDLQLTPPLKALFMQMEFI